VEYVLAVKNVHFEKGTLLDYSNVYLSEWERLNVTLASHQSN
jgi:hypothetical protein